MQYILTIFQYIITCKKLQGHYINAPDLDQQFPKSNEELKGSSWEMTHATSKDFTPEKVN